MENKKNFYEEIFALKNVIRRGWILRNVEGRLESDAEHTMSMIFLAIFLIQKNDLKLDELKVIKMAAFHELCEIDAGDITPVDHVDSKTKYEKELRAIERISSEYDMPEIKELWLEFEENKTPEAQFVKKLDKFDAVMQAKIYSEKGLAKPEVYDEFYQNSKKIADEISSLKF